MNCEFSDRAEKEITYENINDMYFDGERVFAYACLEAGCLVYSQIPIEGHSTIDFFIINLKRLASTGDAGKLVEITLHPQTDITVPDRLTLEFSAPAMRKHRQIENMQATLLPWTILYGEEVKRIESYSGDPSRIYEYPSDELV